MGLIECEDFDRHTGVSSGEEGLPPGPDLGLGWRQGEGEGEVILLLSMI